MPWPKVIEEGQGLININVVDELITLHGLNFYCVKIQKIEISFYGTRELQ